MWILGQRRCNKPQGSDVQLAGAGVYADLDFRALKPMDGLLKGKGQKAVVGRLSDKLNWEQNVPNAWLASSAEHPFWLFCLTEIAKGAHSIPTDCNGGACTRFYLSI